jgi:hypothetical protein
MSVRLRMRLRLRLRLRVRGMCIITLSWLLCVIGENGLKDTFEWAGNTLYMAYRHAYIACHSVLSIPP